MGLINLLPAVKRARGFYLYDDRSERILDLYLDNGRAINGHRPNGLSLAIKNAITRGLYAPYPSIYSARLIKLLQSEYPQFHHVGVYRSLSAFREALGQDLTLCDPLEDPQSDSLMWRPYIPLEKSCTLLVMPFPFPGAEEVAVLSEESRPLPVSDLLPPYILSGLIRSYYDFRKRLDNVSDQEWIMLDRSGHWKRTGPYLKPVCSKEDYDDLFKFYLDSGILISPDYDKPSICAVDLREGSLKKLYHKIKELEDGK